MKRLRDSLRTVGRVILAVAIARVVAGLAIVAFSEGDAVAWGWELTAIVVAAGLVYLAAALAVRWWSQPRQAQR